MSYPSRELRTGVTAHLCYVVVGFAEYPDEATDDIKVAVFDSFDMAMGHAMSNLPCRVYSTNRIVGPEPQPVSP